MTIARKAKPMSLTQAVAEELHAPAASINLVMGDTALTPFDMGTFGSMTTPRMWPQMRRAAAAAREMLVDLAAQQWNVDRASIRIEAGRAASGAHSAGFGELTEGQQLTRTIPAAAPLTPATEWKVAGTSLAKVGGREVVTGAHQYAYDVRRPGMLHAKVLYPPSFGATLVSLDDTAAKAIPGVQVVRVRSKSGREGAGQDLVGVLSPDPDAAEKGLAALKAQWQPATGQPSSQSAALNMPKLTAGKLSGICELFVLR